MDKITQTIEEKFTVPDHFYVKLGLGDKDLNIFIIRITEMCNNNCNFCSTLSTRQTKRVLSFEYIKKLIDNYADENTFLEITGAEPTTHENFFDIIKYADKKFKHISIISNARIFCYEHNIEKLKDIKGISIKSSLHGHNSEIHDSLTCAKGSFDQALLSFKNISSAKITLSVNIVIMKKNIDHLKEIFVLLMNIGVKDIYLSHLIPSNNKEINEKNVISYDELKHKLPNSLSFARENKLNYILEKIPICILNEPVKNFLKETHSTYIKLNKCKDCIYKEICIGVYKDYSESAENDIIPILEKR